MAKRDRQNLSGTDENGLFKVDQEINYASEISKESQINYFQHGQEDNKDGKVPENYIPNEKNNIYSKDKPKVKQSVVNSVLLLLTAVGGTTIVGATALVSLKEIDVSLYYRNAYSLVFSINKYNISNEDRLISYLTYENEIIQEIEISQDRYITFTDLLENSKYQLDIEIYEKYYVENSEKDVIETNPRHLYNASFYTTSYFNEESIYIVDYSLDELFFKVENLTNYSYLTTRVFTNDKELLVDDFTDKYKEYHVANIPEGESLYISLKYMDEGVGYIYLEPVYHEGFIVSFSSNGGTGYMDNQYLEQPGYIVLPSCEFVAPSGQEFKCWMINDVEYQAGERYYVDSDIEVVAVWQDISSDYPTIALIDEIITYNSAELTLNLSNPDYFDSLSIFTDDIYFGNSTIDSNNNILVSFTSLEPESEHYIQIYYQNDIIYSYSFVTDYIVNITSTKSTDIEIEFSSSYYENLDKDTYYGFEIVDSYSNLVFNNQVNSDIILLTDLILYQETYTFNLFTLAATGGLGEVLYSKEFAVEDGYQRADFDLSVENNVLTITYLSGYLDGYSSETVSYYTINVNCEENSYDIYYSRASFNTVGDNISLDLTSGLPSGENSTANYNVDSGTYEVSISYNNSILFKGSFSID